MDTELTKHTLRDEAEQLEVVGVDAGRAAHALEVRLQRLLVRSEQPGDGVQRRRQLAQEPYTLLQLGPRNARFLDKASSGECCAGIEEWHDCIRKHDCQIETVETRRWQSASDYAKA